MRPLLLIARSFLLSSDAQASPVFGDGVESGYSHLHSVVHDPSARVAAISAVDKEVDATRKLLRLLLMRRNALAPVSVLPPEVLARVFHFLARDEPPCLGRLDLGWIRATHVCQLWRQVALGDSSLWARFSGVVTNKELVSEMLAVISAEPGCLAVATPFWSMETTEFVAPVPAVEEVLCAA